MKTGLDGQASMTSTYLRHFDTCLGCMACVTACPSGVKYDRLIEATRPQLERRAPRPLADRAFRRLLFALFTRPARLRRLPWPLWLYPPSRLPRLLRGSGAPRWLPPPLAAMEPAAGYLAGAVRRELPERWRHRRAPAVGLLLGCVQRSFGEVNAATVRAASAEG